jgi:hypothetical protein
MLLWLCHKPVFYAEHRRSMPTPIFFRDMGGPHYMRHANLAL